MSHKQLKAMFNSDPPPCEKYINKLLRQEAYLANSKKLTTPRTFQDKFSHIGKPATLPPQRPKPKANVKQHSPIQKMTVSVLSNMQKEHLEIGGVVKEAGKASRREQTTTSSLSKSPTRVRSNSKLREAWGQLLKSNRSKDKVSNFGNFDPLRTLHFLSKELFTRLKDVAPEQDELLQMVSDIQHALKRIPPEVTTLLHKPQIEYAASDVSGSTHKSTSTKTCQTPPTLYQEDTERFQQIMTENTYRLEASCKQLEEVCASLQSEKELTEKELEDAKENVEVLCRRVRELEEEIENISEIKMKQLEVEKQELQEQLNSALQGLDTNPKLIDLTKVIEELQRQKKTSDEGCSLLQYDMTILKMEKEKVVTMLAVRDKELQQIQSEMAKIQDQVNLQLKKLNTDTLERAKSMKTLSDEFNGMAENLFLDFGGDTTVSSVATGDGKEKPAHAVEASCGDAKLPATKNQSQEELLKKLTAHNVELDLLARQKENEKDEEPGFESLIEGLTPSMQTFLKSHNI